SAPRERIDRRRVGGPAPHESAARESSGGRRRRDRIRDRAQGAPRRGVPPDRGADRVTAVLAVSPARPTLVRAVCVREWREALGNKLLVGMTLLPPVVILVAGIAAVAAAAVHPPSDRDVPALYAAAPAVAGLDPKEAVQGFIA